MIRKNNTLEIILLKYVYIIIFIFFLFFISTTKSNFYIQKIFSKNKFFLTPESFQFDYKTNTYYISNINGNPSSFDNNGFITKLDSNFNIINKYFIKSNKQFSLNAPKGIAIFNNLLAVTDINTVKYFDKNSGKFLKTIDLSIYNASFLNDCIFDKSGNLYVSDTSSNRIYKISLNNEIRIFTKINSPNGMIIVNEFLIIVTWNNAKLYKINLTQYKGFSKPLNKNNYKKVKVFNIEKYTKSVTIFSFEKLKNLDGIDYIDNNNIIFSDFTDGKIYLLNLKTYELFLLIDGINSPADISFNRKSNFLLIPHFNDGISVFKIQ